jgi:ribose transport system substrate-binding protein
MMRIKCVAVLILAAFFFAGCSKTVNTTAPDGKRRKIGVSIPTADHGWTAGTAWWAKQAIDAHPEIQWVFQQSATPAAQIADIESMLSQHIDGLVILPHSGATLTAVAKEAHDQGVFIVNVDRGFTEPVADVFLEGDNKAFGRKSADFIVDRMGGKGNLVIIRGIESTTVDQDRYNSAKAVLDAHPDIKIVGEEEGGWDKAQALKKMEALLQKNPHIDAVWCQDDDMAVGVIQAITEAHREKEMWVLGGAGMKDIVKKVMDGDPMVPADITYPPSMVGCAVHLAASTLRDGKVKELAPMMPHHLTLDVELITPKNAKDFYFPNSAY